MKFIAYFIAVAGSLGASYISLVAYALTDPPFFPWACGFLVIAYLGSFTFAYVIGRQGDILQTSAALAFPPIAVFLGHWFFALMRSNF